MNTTNLQSDIAAARAKLDAVSAELRALEERAKQEPIAQARWEPKGGDFTILNTGRIRDTTDYAVELSNSEATTQGSCYPTQEAAESALPYVTFFKRLCCLAQELNPSGKVGGVFRISLYEEWEVKRNHMRRDVWDLFETLEAATRAAQILNRDQWTVPSL